MGIADFAGDVLLLFLAAHDGDLRFAGVLIRFRASDQSV
jgi:hypothetical protein